MLETILQSYNKKGVFHFGRGPLKEQFCKILSKNLRWDSSKCQFSFFPLEVSGNYKLP